MPTYTPQQYLEMVLLYGEFRHLAAPATEAAREYRERFDAPHPDARTIENTVRRLGETGKFKADYVDNGRPRTRRNAHTEEIVLAAVEENPGVSVREISRMHEVPKDSVHRILVDEGLHPYHYTRVQHLLPHDYFRRKDFCRWFLQRHQRDPEFTRRIIFSDQCMFTREGVFNCHNMHHWAEENPNVTTIRSFQTRWSVNVWAGILDDRILGPIILPERLTGQLYKEMLQHNLPEFLEDVPLVQRNSIWYQQDGAGPHNARLVTNFLRDQFGERWIGTNGPKRWPARSPDMNPLDFFLWGHLKGLVYREIPRTEDELVARLHGAVATIDGEMISRVHGSLLKRARACIEADGGHFEHLL